MPPLPYADRPFDNAHPFIDALARRTGLFPGSSDLLPKWIFRGQRNAAWPLLPRALRPGEVIDARDWPPTIPELAFAEAGYIHDFLELADAVGLPIPGDLQQLRHVLTSTLSRSIGALADLSWWPRPELLPLLGLAQHYGVPTRLLDWTFSPYVAAYFAASGAAEYERDHPGEVDRLCIWAATPADLFSTRAGVAVPETPWDVGWQTFYRPVRVSRAENPNLHAQEGVLFLAVLAQKNDNRVVADPVETLRDRPPGAELVRCTLPVSEAGELLRLLTIEGRFHGAAIYPGFDGVGRSVRERRQLWPKPA